MIKLAAMITATMLAAPCSAGQIDIPQDKAGHLAGGVVIGAGVTAASGDPGLGALAAIAAGVAKEVIDGPAGGHQEVADAVFTAVGGLIGSALAGAAMTIDRNHGRQHPKPDQFDTSKIDQLRGDW